MKEVALKLGLLEGASEAEMLAAVVNLNSSHVTETAALKTAKETAEAEVARLKKEKTDAEKAEATVLVDQAIKDGKITADLKDDYLEMFSSDFVRTKKILAGATSRTKLSDLAGKAGTGSTEAYASLSWDELDKKGLLADLKANNPDLYQVKYKEMSAVLNISRG